MGRICCAYNCGLRETKDCPITFHKFPLADKELCRRWINATKLKDFTPSENTRIFRQHFKTDDFLFSDSKKSKAGAVPSVFSVRNQTSQSAGDKRKAPTPANTEFVTPVKKSRVEDAQTTSVNSKRQSPSKLDLKKKIKVLHQKVRRRDKKIESLNSLVNDLLEKKLISEDVSKILDENFSGLPLDIIQNHFKNKDRKSTSDNGTVMKSSDSR